VEQGAVLIVTCIPSAPRAIRGADGFAERAGDDLLGELVLPNVLLNLEDQPFCSARWQLTSVDAGLVGSGGLSTSAADRKRGARQESQRKHRDVETGHLQQFSYSQTPEGAKPAAIKVPRIR